LLTWFYKPSLSIEAQKPPQMKTLCIFIIVLATSLNVYSQLSGTYTIGASGDYGTFNEAVDALSIQGVSAAVTFNVEPGVYNEQVVIPEIPTASLSNNITFQSTTNDSTDVELTYASTNGDSAYVIKFDTTQYITFRYITISSGSPVYAHSMVVLCNSPDIQFYNCHFAGSLSATDYRYTENLIISDEQVYSGDNFRIENSCFLNGWYALLLNGKSETEKTVNAVITGNIIHDQIRRGVELNNYSDVSIDNNLITGSPSYSAIKCDHCFNVNIENNDILATLPDGTVSEMHTAIGIWYSSQIDIRGNVISNFGTFGIDISSGDDDGSVLPQISNNFIFGDGTGLRINYSHFYEVYHNSVYSTGNCLQLEADETKVYNNIFYNYSEGTTIDLSSYCNNPDFDYNDYYTEGAQIATWLDIPCATLSDLQTTSGQDANSSALNPDFLATDDLHTFSTDLNGAALAGLETTDIDGEPRDGANPDMGADEFTPLTYNLAMIDVTLPSDCDLTAAEPVFIKFVNRGTANYGTIPVRYTIDGGTTFINETISQAVNTGDTVEYTFVAPVDMATPDEYVCTASVEESNDELPGDNFVTKAFNSYGSLNSYPFQEDFEVNNSYNFKLSSNSDAQVTINSSAANNSNYGLDFAYSNAGSHYWDWQGGDTPDSTQLWVDNAYFHGFATSCNVDVSGMTNPALQFDMKVYISLSSIQAWFRVLVDGTTELIDIEGTKEFHETSTTAFQTKVFELNQLTTDNFELAFQSCVRSSPHIYIDNIIIGEKPVVELGADQTTCEGTPWTFDAGVGTGYTYAWFKEGSTDTLVKTQTYATDVSGTYFVHVYSDAGIISKDTVALTVNPSYSFVKDTAICDCEILTWHGQDYTETGTYYDNQQTELSCDSTFTLNLTVNPTYTYTETYAICENDSLLWHGAYYQEPGTFYDSLLTMEGCDSVYTLELSNYPTFSEEQASTICSNDSLLWRGTYYNETGIYYDSLASVFACDSVYLLYLTANPAYSYFESSTICDNDSLLWRGDYYKNAGTYYDSLTTISSCDSVYVLELFVNPTYFSSDPFTICSNDSILWHDSYYNETGFYYDSLSSIDGCDSVIMLDLTINQAYEFVETASICDSDSLAWRGEYYNVSGMYYDSLTTVLGCDSVYVLELFMNPTYHYLETASICDNDSIFWQGNYYFDAGTYYDSHTTTLGCDSVYELQLTENPTYEYFDNETICNGESILWHGNYLSEQGDYTHTYTTEMGCDSVYNIFVQVFTVDTTVTIIDNTMYANANNATFSWINCSDGSPLGIYASDFPVLENGEYAVIVTQEGCIDTSSCYVMNVDAIDNFDALAANYHVYPNPAQELVIIEGGAIESIRIQDTHGKIVATKNYILQINTGKFIISKLILIE
jgi:hypothetical protein